MEKKLMASLEWEVRPVSPHVLAYKILDNIPVKIEFAVKRQLVNIVERVSLNLLQSKCNFSADSAYIVDRHRHFPFSQNYMNSTNFPVEVNILLLSVVSGLEYGFRTLFQGYSMELVEMVKRIVGPFNAHNILITSRHCKLYAELAPNYGDPILLAR
jgi:hypothetical protein